MPQLSIPRMIQPGHPEALGLLACYVAMPGGMIDLKTGEWGTRSGTDDPMRTSEEGTLDAYFDGDGDSYLMAAQEFTVPFSVWWEAYLDAFVDAFPVICVLQIASTANTFRIFYSNNASYNDISFSAAASGANARCILMPSGCTQTGQRHWGVITYDGVNAGADSSYTCYINGQLATFSTASANATITDENRIGSHSATTPDWNGPIRQVRVYSGLTSQAQANEFFLNRGSGLFWPDDGEEDLYGETAPAAGVFIPIIGRGPGLQLAGGRGLVA